MSARRPEYDNDKTVRKLFPSGLHIGFFFWLSVAVFKYSFPPPKTVFQCPFYSFSNWLQPESIDLYISHLHLYKREKKQSTKFTLYIIYLSWFIEIHSSFFYSICRQQSTSRSIFPCSFSSPFPLLFVSRQKLHFRLPALNALLIDILSFGLLAIQFWTIWKFEQWSEIDGSPCGGKSTDRSKIEVHSAIWN